MQEEFYGMEDLERARKLQREMRDLHIPTAPVLSLKVELIDTDGTILRRIHAKSNSYLRNAYNLIAHCVGFYPSSAYSMTQFIDGKISFVEMGGAFRNISTQFKGYKTGRLGSGTTPDTLDDIEIEVNSTLWDTTTLFSKFDSGSDTLVTDLICRGVNLTTSTENVSECGVYVELNLAEMFLIIRDVFPAVPVAPMQQIIITYSAEVAYA